MQAGGDDDVARRDDVAVADGQRVSCRRRGASMRRDVGLSSAIWAPCALGMALKRHHEAVAVDEAGRGREQRAGAEDGRFELHCLRAVS